jgi:hypothetical protein
VLPRSLKVGLDYATTHKITWNYSKKLLLLRQCADHNIITAYRYIYRRVLGGSPGALTFDHETLVVPEAKWDVLSISCPHSMPQLDCSAASRGFQRTICFLFSLTCSLSFYFSLSHTHTNTHALSLVHTHIRV